MPGSFSACATALPMPAPKAHSTAPGTIGRIRKSARLKTWAVAQAAGAGDAVGGHAHLAALDDFQRRQGPGEGRQLADRPLERGIPGVVATDSGGTEARDRSAAATLIVVGGGHRRTIDVERELKGVDPPTARPVRTR